MPRRNVHPPRTSQTMPTPAAIAASPAIRNAFSGIDSTSRRQPLRKRGKAAIDQALDDEDQAYGGEEVLTPRPYWLVPAVVPPARRRRAGAGAVPPASAAGASLAVGLRK